MPMRRERVDIPDGDFWDFDWLDAKPAHDGALARSPRNDERPTPPRNDGGSTLPRDDAAPTLVVFHGLEGGSSSHYARAIFDALLPLGWRGVVPHFRGCSGEPNRMPRAYHSGDHEEVGAMLAAVRARVGERAPLYAVGVSLGGSALLNWLGRTGVDGTKVVRAAAAVSAPLDLVAAGISIGRGVNRVYTRHFLATLKPKSLAMAARFPGLLDPARIRRARTLRAFDDVVTAPLHGFADALDYWTRASSKPWLARIAVPTLVLNARNDPFIPARSLPGPGEVSKAIVLEQPRHGGHAGFARGPFPGNVDWLPRRLLHFFLHEAQALAHASRDLQGL